MMIAAKAVLSCSDGIVLDVYSELNNEAAEDCNDKTYVDKSR